MALNQAQLVTLKADIAADPVLSILPMSNASGDTIAAAYNSAASPDFIVWNPSTATKDVMDAITWANLTPSDAPDGTAAWTNRALACQGKQFNIQTMLVGRDLVDATKVNLVAGLQDALTNVPSGAAGATKSGGWANVKIALTRKATRAEKLFGSGTGTAATPGLMGFIGRITQDDVTTAREMS
jgi:hypothetical protein